MTSQTKALFDHYRDDLLRAGIATTHQDSLICPLCWQETRLLDLSVEHAIPGSVGGTAVVLTCRRCNNNHGSSLDAHLAQFQAVADAFKGHGTIPTILDFGGRRIVANLEMSHGAMNFRVVGKATDPRMEERVRSNAEPGQIQEFNVRFDFGYAKNQFETAVLRAAYLVLFKRFAYWYANNEVVQVVRRRICDPTLEFPRLKSMILGIPDAELPQDQPYLLASGNLNDVPFFLVILRIRKRTTGFLGSLMPHPSADAGMFFELLDEYARWHESVTLTIPAGGLFT